MFFLSIGAFACVAIALTVALADEPYDRHPEQGTGIGVEATDDDVRLDCGDPATAMARWENATKRTPLAIATITIRIRHLEPEGEIDSAPIELSPEERQELLRIFQDPGSYSDCPGVIGVVCESVVIDVRTKTRDTRSFYCQMSGNVKGSEPDSLNMILSDSGRRRWERFLRALLKSHA